MEGQILSYFCYIEFLEIRILGDDNFFQMIRDYASNLNFAYKHATTENFKNQIYTSTGKDFTEFFKDCVYGEGYLTYTIKWNQPHCKSRDLFFNIPNSKSFFR